MRNLHIEIGKMMQDKRHEIAKDSNDFANRKNSELILDVNIAEVNVLEPIRETVVLEIAEQELIRIRDNSQ